ncbi:peptidase M20, partial [Corynebacterium sp. BCW_4722]
AVGSGSGRVVFLGTPAEEGHSGKEYMIRGGMLDGVDCAVMIHPFSYDLVSHAWTGRRTLTATFTGVAAHASMQPYMGRNALDAAMLAYQAMGLLRQQMPPSDRLHAIISEGGARASIIPEQATLQIYVRSLYTDTLMDLSQRVEDILRGAAMMTGTAVDIAWDTHPMSLPVRNNEALAARFGATQQALGRDVLPGGILPDSQAASTDFGNVSHLVPGIHPMVKIAPEGTALHTTSFADAAITDAALKGAYDSAVGLGQVVADILNDADLLAAAREEFEAAGGAVAVDKLLES